MFKGQKLEWISFGLVLALLSVLNSCAYEVAPRGGPKDTTAPKMLISHPDKNATNVSTSKFKLTFDEFVQVSKPKDNILFSPPIENIKDVYVLGKSLYIELDDTLKKDESYELLLSNAVLDVNEKNPLRNFKLNFATGDSLYKLRIVGQLLDYTNNKPVANENIVLHPDTLDSVLVSAYPLYITRTDQNGFFNFGNLKEGTYKVFALDDANYNLKFDSPSEKVAFRAQSVSVKIDTFIHDTSNYQIFELDSMKVLDSLTNELKWIKDTLTIDTFSVDTIGAQIIDTVKLLLFEEAKTNFFIETVKKRNIGGFYFQYNDQIDSIKFNALTEGFEVVYETFELSDSFRIWQLNQSRDTLEIEVQINHNFTDTVEVYLDSIDTLDRKIQPLLKQELSAKWKHIKPNIFFDQSPLLYFNSPIDSVVYDSIEWKEKDSVIQVKMLLDSSRMFLKADYDWKEDRKYRCFIPDSVIWDGFGRTQDTLKLLAKTKKIKSYGTISLSITDSLSRDFIVFFKKGKDVVKQYDIEGDSTQIFMEYIHPGEYSLRFVHDRDHDNKWSTGKLLEEVQPERFYNYPIKLNVKGGFDLEQEIDLNGIKF